MAITKIHAIKSTLACALNYIENPDKTLGQLLISGYNVDPQLAAVDFEMTASLARQVNYRGKRSPNLAYHLIQSFAPNDPGAYAQAHELGRQLAAQYAGGRFEYVVDTHIDQENHIHNHIMINAVSFYDYHRLRTIPYKTARELRAISDRLCTQAGLSVICRTRAAYASAQAVFVLPHHPAHAKHAGTPCGVRRRVFVCTAAGIQRISTCSW